MELERLAAIPPAVDEQRVEDELREYMGDQPANPARQPWRITSLGAADWAIRMLGDARAQVQRYDDEIELWKRARARVDNVAGWFEERLKEWAVAERTDRVKSFPLAHGTISTRESKPRAIVVDEAAAIAWARQHAPEALKVETSFLISQAGVQVAELVVGFTSTDKSSGEVETLTVAPVVPHEAKLTELRERLGDGFVVEPILELFPVATVEVVAEPGVARAKTRIVPGLAVKPGDVSATVKPLGL